LPIKEILLLLQVQMAQSDSLISEIFNTVQCFIKLKNSDPF